MSLHDFISLWSPVSRLRRHAVNRSAPACLDIETLGPRQQRASRRVLLGDGATSGSFSYSTPSDHVVVIGCEAAIASIRLCGLHGFREGNALSLRALPTNPLNQLGTADGQHYVVKAPLATGVKLQLPADTRYLVLTPDAAMPFTRGLAVTLSLALATGTAPPGASFFTRWLLAWRRTGGLALGRFISLRHH